MRMRLDKEKSGLYTVGKRERGVISNELNPQLNARMST